jgi:light-regulated signal transduction histidine kinase (bacteriophytochrome)
MYRDGQLIGAVVTFVDISTRKQVEAELKKSNEELERRVAERTAELKTSNEDLETFAYSVSHDLRAPLRAIDGFCRLLEMDHSERLDGEAARYLAQVRRASQRMSRLIEDLLQMSSAARVSLTIMSVDLSAVARNIISQLQVADKDRQVSVVIEDGLRARCDPQLVTLLLENLLGNAWKFTRRTADARIRFGCEAVLGETVFYVRDNGAGFDMEFAHKLFAPFQRLHSPDEFEGTGIGLASVARVAARHKGRAWGEGKPGEGAVFYFTLPSAPPGA